MMDIVSPIIAIIKERDDLIKAVEKYNETRTTGDMFAMFELLPDKIGAIHV